MNEAITKSAQTAALLTSDLREAFNGGDPLLAIMVTDLLGQAVALQQRLELIQAAVDQPNEEVLYTFPTGKTLSLVRDAKYCAGFGVRAPYIFIMGGVEIPVCSGSVHLAEALEIAKDGATETLGREERMLQLGE